MPRACLDRRIAVGAVKHLCVAVIDGIEHSVFLQEGPLGAVPFHTSSGGSFNEKEIYLDNASTTQATPEVCRAVHEALAVTYGNPSSPHTLGLAAEETVRDARRALAAYLGVPERGVIFTSGTESVNMAVFGGPSSQRQGIYYHLGYRACRGARSCKALEEVVGG